MKQTDRIAEMENICNMTEETLGKVEKALEEYSSNLKNMKKLFDYYGSTVWMKDYEDDSRGKFPKDLKRGVLSEDTIYDLILDNRELVRKMAGLIDHNIGKELL